MDNIRLLIFRFPSTYVQIANIVSTRLELGVENPTHVDVERF
jgi:hypothetical protein